MDINGYMARLGQQARVASKLMAVATTVQKNQALITIAEMLIGAHEALMTANSLDLEAGRDQQLSPALLDRLALDESRIHSMADGLNQIAALPDPVGELTDLCFRPSGIQVGRMRVPLGVVGIIYESRPNVTADAAALCLKSGNATILRGGSEAKHSNQAIAKVIAAGLLEVGLPSDAVQVVDTTDRAAVGALISQPEYVDVIVPRGGKGLIERISKEARVPVIKHLDGNCHLFVHEKANLEMARKVAFNAKTQRYGTCNTLESLLVAEPVAAALLPKLIADYQQAGVEIRGCAKTRELISGLVAATDEDWETEYLAPILAVRVVSGLDEALAHIDAYSSRHTESIITDDVHAAQRFLREVDSSSVMLNASTRFADGFEYGLGAEIGISTDKIHARGPVGLEGLTSQKFIVIGQGHIRE